MAYHSRDRGYLHLVSLAVLTITVFLTYANRVDNVDFWWHLKSGQAVVQARALPEKDVFSYTTGSSVHLTDKELTDAGISMRPSSFPLWGTNLRQSWLGQVLFYMVYEAAGFPGIGIFKAVIFIFCFLTLYWAMRRKGGGTVSSLSTLFLIVVICRDFASSRPQFFTFFFLAVLVALFVDFKRNGKKILILPGCFLIWQNLHGGFVVGIMMLVIFWFSEIGKYIAHNRFKFFERSVSDFKSIKFLSLVSIITILTTYANPNHFKIYLVPFALKNSLFTVVEEYSRPMLYEFHAYWLMLFVILFLFIVLVKYNDITDVLLVSFLLISSQVGLRGIILFAIGAGPFMASSLTRCWQWVRQRRITEKLFDTEAVKRLASLQPLHLIFLLFLLYFGVNNALAHGVLNFSLNDDLYPGKAVNFLRNRDYPRHLFNAYDWGGYLIWKYPERQVFIDGRCLDEKAFFHYQLIINALGDRARATAQGNTGLALWKKLLDQYDVQVVLTNAITYNGQLVPLVDKLSADPDWGLVYQDGTALVFLRDSPGNRRRFGRDFLPKLPRIYDEIIAECQQGLARNPATWNYYKLLGSTYFIRRDLVKARKMFEKYLAMNPGDSEVIQNLNLIRSFSGEAPLDTGNSSQPYHHW